MKNLLLGLFLSVAVAFGADATVLFPHFVDIAPEFEKGITPELEAAGVECAMYHSTHPGFLTSKFSEVESFFRDTLPSDVEREERKVGDYRLVIYSSRHENNDVIKTNPVQYTIYVLELPDDGFRAAYCEREIEE